MNNKEWYRHAKSDAIEEQESSLEQGLSHEQVRVRLNRYGPNLLEDFKRKGAWKILLSQFSNWLVIVLLIAGVVAGFVGEPQDSAVIGAIIILNAVIGFFQEYRAERTMDALKKLAAPMATVRRMGQNHTVSAHDLVPGDIVLLKAGNIVPADLRVLETFGFEVDESLLTGESLPVFKSHESIESLSVPVADQRNMAFKGTRVTKGRASGLVVNTGASTELGKIAKLIKEEVEVSTPLQRKIADFAKKISVLVLVVCLIIFIVGLVRGEDTWLMLMTSLSLAVAAIPEALPAVVAVSLALGARIMAKKNALVRKLPAVEALGAVTCICSDKTGTLTENRMKVTRIFFENSFYEGFPEKASDENELAIFAKVLLLSNDVVMGADGKWHGDPTEIALVEAATPFLSQRQLLEDQMPRIAEVPFTSERGMMSTLHRLDGRAILLSKGAPEKFIPLCKGIEVSSIYRVAEQMGEEGLRVLAVGYRRISFVDEELDFEDMESDFTFLGLVGMMDPPPSRGVRFD